MDHSHRPTAVPVRALAINAAFLKDIKDDNRELKQLLDRFAPLLEHSQIAANHWSELIELLGQLRDQLALHFALEEAYGYFEHAIETSPQLTVAVESLRAQHSTMFVKIRQLADQALEVPSDQPEKVAALIGRLQAFQQEFRQHEEAELELILDALENDLGVGD